MAEAAQTALFDAPTPKGVESVEWYTPAAEMALVHHVFDGPPDLDPLSCELANRVVRARTFYDVAADGMAQRWAARTIYVNPPTGLTQPAWAKLCEHFEAGDFEAAIWAGFNLEQLQTLQRAGHALWPLAFPVCVPATRTRWLRGDAAQADLFGELPQVGKSPRHGTFFVLLDRTGDYTPRFWEAFGAIGGLCAPGPRP